MPKHRIEQPEDPGGERGCMTCGFTILGIIGWMMGIPVTLKISSEYAIPEAALAAALTGGIIGLTRLLVVAKHQEINERLQSETVVTD